MGERCYNRLELVAEEQKVKKVLQFIESTDEKGKINHLDFNKIIPLPEFDVKANDWDKISFEKWGCRWSIDTVIEDEKIISFTTGNGDATTIIEKLSTLFPDVEFIYEIVWSYPFNDKIMVYKRGEMVQYF